MIYLIIAACVVALFVFCMLVAHLIEDHIYMTANHNFGDTMVGSNISWPEWHDMMEKQLLQMGPDAKWSTEKQGFDNVKIKYIKKLAQSHTYLKALGYLDLSAENDEGTVFVGAEYINFPQEPRSLNTVIASMKRE